MVAQTVGVAGNVAAVPTLRTGCGGCVVAWLATVLVRVAVCMRMLVLMGMSVAMAVIMPGAAVRVGMQAGLRGLGNTVAMVHCDVPGNHEAMCGNEQNAQSGY